MNERISKCSVLRENCVWKTYYTYLVGKRNFLLICKLQSIHIYGAVLTPTRFCSEHFRNFKPALGNTLRNQSKNFTCNPFPFCLMNERVSTSSVRRDKCAWNRPSPRFLRTQSFFSRANCNRYIYMARYSLQLVFTVKTAGTSHQHYETHRETRVKVFPANRSIW